MLTKALRRLLLRRCLLASACVWPCVASPQTPNALPLAASQLAVEFPDQNGCAQDFTLTSPLSIGLFPAANLRHVPNPDPNIRQPSALRLELKTSGDTVSIVAMVLYGEFDTAKATGSVENIPHEFIAAHSGKLTEGVAFFELQRVGLEPITFHIVTPQSIATRHPMLRSNAPSVQLDDYAARDRIAGSLTVHNLSAKAVVAYRVGSSPDGESGWSEETLPRIASGATSQLTVSDGSQAIADGTCVEDPKPSVIFLQAALFDDGSYEGNMPLAAQLAAHRLGHDIQRQRIRSLTGPILADPDLEVTSTIEHMRSAVDQLTAEPDADTISRLHAQFPDLSESDVAALASEVRNQMKEEKESASSELQRHETEISPRETQASLARWWALNNED